jgi:hypothetical protein
MDVIRSVGHLRLDLAGPLVMDDSVQCSGHWCCITGCLGQCQPYQKWVISCVDHMENRYDLYNMQYVFSTLKY